MSHPFDCWITPPCAAIALGRWFCSMLPPFDLALDPFAGPATLVPWTGLAEHAHARELDPRWESEARTRSSRGRPRTAPSLAAEVAVLRARVAELEALLAARG